MIWNEICNKRFRGMIFQLKILKVFEITNLLIILFAQKIISRLGPLVFHEYLLRFGKTKLILHTSKYVKQTKKVINIHFPDFLN